MKEIEFNLLTEPWVRVRLPDNTVQEVSLTDALLHAQDYVDLAGEMPTQDAAMLRLLLAVLFTVFSRVNVEGEPEPFEEEDDALARWGDLWQLGHFPEQPLRDYLEQWKDRFWLFHPTHPFWQVPTLSNGIAFDGKKLNGERAESGNKTPLFQNVSKEACEALTYAQAARWLIYQNGYDERGGRPKAGNKPRHGVGWLGQIGFVAVKGKNLYETLLRNMAFPTEQDALQEKQAPCWEQECAKAEQSVEIVMPKNQAELLTLQSRRILLKRSETVPGVVGYEVLGGDYWNSENAFGEQMTLWRRTSKENEKVTYEPQQHEMGKQLWRELPSMLEPEGRKPGVLIWNQTLQSLRILSGKEQIVISVVGIRYDDQGASVKDVYTDQLKMQLATLNDLGRKWTVRINREVQRCEDTAKNIGTLCMELKLAGGLDYNKVKGFKDKQKVTEDARAQFYFAVDQPFRQWLQAIDPEQDDPDEAALRWQVQARNIAEKLGKQMVMEAGNAALKGHRIEVEKTQKTENKSKTILYTSPKAYNRFCAKLWESFLRGMPEDFQGRSGPSHAEWAVYLALTLYAVHQQGNDQPMNRPNNTLGRAVRQLAERNTPAGQDWTEASVLRRFNALATAEEITEISHHLRGMIQLLSAAKDGGIPLDYPQLAADLYELQCTDPRYAQIPANVRLRWGQDLYRETKPAPEENEKEN